MTNLEIKDKIVADLYGMSKVIRDLTVEPITPDTADVVVEACMTFAKSKNWATDYKISFGMEVQGYVDGTVEVIVGAFKPMTFAGVNITDQVGVWIITSKVDVSSIVETSLVPKEEVE